MRLPKIKRHADPILVFVCIVLLCAAGFLACIAVGPSMEIISRRAKNSPLEIIEASEEVTEEESAPADLVREFTFVLDPDTTEGSWLMFYVHNSITQVQIGDTIVYEEHGSPEQISSSGIGGRWVSIPLRQSDFGQTCIIRLIPIYQYSVNNSVTIYTGSPQHLMWESIKQDSPEILSCIICIAVGILYIALSIVNYRNNRRYSALGWLGATALFMSFWKLLDLRSFSLVCHGNSALFYLASLSCLSLAPIAAVMYARVVCTALPLKLMNFLSAFMAVVCALQYVLQFAGLVPLRGTLSLSHFNIILAYLIVLFESIVKWKKTGNARPMILPLIIAVGGFMDLAVFYRDSLSQSIMFSLLAMAVYIMLSGILFLYSVDAESRIDSLTGLYNQKYWREIKYTRNASDEKPGIAVMDLNGLKRVNDTMGHQAGDRYIRGFAQILQQAQIHRMLLFRIGGDEFLAYLPNAKQEQLNRFEENLEAELQAWNAQHQDNQISVSYGFVLFRDHPDLSLDSLCHLADEKMYEAKNDYYRRTGLDRRKV